LVVKNGTKRFAVSGSPGPSSSIVAATFELTQGAGCRKLLRYARATLGVLALRLEGDEVRLLLVQLGGGPGVERDEGGGGARRLPLRFEPSELELGVFEHDDDRVAIHLRTGTHCDTRDASLSRRAQPPDALGNEGPVNGDLAHQVPPPDALGPDRRASNARQRGLRSPTDRAEEHPENDRGRRERHPDHAPS
jgi:hypothetical protein